MPVTISWSPVGYAETYHFQLASDDKFGSIRADVNNLTNAFYTLDTLEKDVHYYWRVKALNDSGESSWTATHMFTAIAPFITVTKPNGGELWQRGLSYFIQWNDNIVEDVVIQLYKGDKLSTTIASTSNHRAYKWYISTTFAIGSDYSIKIKSKTDTLFDISDKYFAVIDTTNTFVKNESSVVKDYALYQNYPNPFNPTTTIYFALPSQSFVSLKVFDMLGRKVATLVSENMSAGSYTRQWNATNISSGIYFYRLQAGSFTETKKLVLLR